MACRLFETSLAVQQRLAVQAASIPFGSSAEKHGAFRLNIRKNALGPGGGLVTMLPEFLFVEVQ